MEKWANLKRKSTAISFSKAQTVTVAAIERGVATLAEARDVLAEFQAITASRRSPNLTLGSTAPDAALSPSSPRISTNYFDFSDCYLVEK